MLPRKTIVKLLSTHMLALTVLLALGFVLPAQAAILTDGEITITEVGGDDVPEGQYEVSNGSVFNIFAFAVSNNYTTGVSTDGVDASNGEFILWDSKIINSGLWGTTTIFNPTTETFVGLDSFGEFTNFFDQGDSINLYSFGETGLINPGASVSDAFFFTPGTINSTAVAFFTNGTGVALTAVPTPTAFLLFGTGLVGLIGLKRRLAS